MSRLSRYPYLRNTCADEALERMKVFYPDLRSFEPKPESGSVWRAHVNALDLGRAAVLVLDLPPFTVQDHSAGRVRAYVPFGRPFEMQSGSVTREFLPYRPALAPQSDLSARFHHGLRTAAFDCPEADLGAAIMQLEGRFSLKELQDGFFGSDMLPLGRFHIQLRATILALDDAPQAIVASARLKSVHQELLTLHLAQALSGRQPDGPKLQDHGRYLSRAIAYLRANYESELLLSDLAAAAGCSLRTLQFLFRQEMETTPMRYLMRVRLQQAQMRLSRAHEGETVTSIALDCGFSHMGEFGAAYLREFGERPSQTLALTRRTGV